jgi:processive 1,2-diacylglycerol beta-glucosyltransferase
MIWVLTSAFGDGHNSAARSVAEALRLERPGLEVEVTDLIAKVHPVAAWIAQQAYQGMIIHAPWLWRKVYDGIANSDVARKETEWHRPQLLAVRDFLETRKPKVVVCTFPAYIPLFEMLAKTGFSVPPVVTVITDSISVHPSWIAAPSDRYLLPDEETREVMLQMGIPAEKLCVAGFPVSLRFMQARQMAVGQSVLYMPSTKAAVVVETLQALVPAMRAGLRMTLLAGKHHRRLYHSLRGFLDAHPELPIQLLGWSQQVPELLLSHDLVITKAGGAILHEAMAACAPVVIDYVVPGQEEGNADYAVTHGVGLRSQSPAETAAAVERLLANGGAEAQQMRQTLQGLAAPDAAVRAAREVLTFDN